MTINEEKITVEKHTIFAETVPVKIMFDKWLDDPICDDHFVECQKFRMIETDGYLIVSIENFGERIEPSISFKCFIHEKDAWSYLEMFGIEKESDDDEE